MARNNEAKKYYLSPAAVARLRAESERTTYSMSVVLDQLIMKSLPPLEGVAPVSDADLRTAALTRPTIREQLEQRMQEPKSEFAIPPADAATANPKERFKIDL